MQIHRQERVFISHAGPQKGFALHLRTVLRNAGISTFVDERELLPGGVHSSADIMEAACRRAQLVVFIITHDFLRRPAAIQELRWALDQRWLRQQQGAAADEALPHLLTVLYPTSVTPSWREPELQQLLGRELQLVAENAAQPNLAAVAKRINTATNDQTPCCSCTTLMS